MTLSTEPTFTELVNAVCHVAENERAYLELYVNGIVFRIFPSRVIAPSEKDRLKRFATFILALVRMTSLGESEFALRTINDLSVGLSGMEIGVLHMNGMAWMPCEIDRVELPPGPPAFSIPSIDDDDDEDRTNRVTVPLRKILL